MLALLPTSATPPGSIATLRGWLSASNLVFWVEVRVADSKPADTSENALAENETLPIFEESYSLIFVESCVPASLESVMLSIPVAVAYEALEIVGGIVSCTVIELPDTAEIVLSALSVTAPASIFKDIVLALTNLARSVALSVSVTVSSEMVALPESDTVLVPSVTLILVPFTDFMVSLNVTNTVPLPV